MTQYITASLGLWRQLVVGAGSRPVALKSGKASVFLPPLIPSSSSFFSISIMGESLQCGQRGVDEIIDESREKRWAGAGRGKARQMQSFLQRIWEEIIYLKYSCHVDGAAQSFASEFLAFCFSFVDMLEHILRTRYNYGTHHKHSTEDML